MNPNESPNRRQFLKWVGTGVTVGAIVGARDVFAQDLVKTPSLSAGPYYPTPLPADTDNDLVSIGGSKTLAAGAILSIAGRVLNAAGRPARMATVEIWQPDNTGAYLH